MSLSWETCVAMLLLPLIIDLRRRWMDRQKPFDGSWTLARVIGLLLGRQYGEQWRARTAQIGRENLPALPTPSTHQVVSEQAAIEGSSSDVAAGK